MRCLVPLFVLGLTLSGAAPWRPLPEPAAAQDAGARDTTSVNRVPVSDQEFARIADYYGYDRELPLKASTIGQWPYRRPYVIEKVEFSSTHDQRVPAYFTHPKDTTAVRHPAVLLLHGMNDFWGRNEDWALEWMDILSREGWCVLVEDFYGFGERKMAGKPDPWELPPYARRDAAVQCVTDQRRGLDYLSTRDEVDSTRIALLGGSMGGYYGVMVAGLEKRLTCVVLTVTSAWPEKATDDHMFRFVHTLNFAPRITAPVLMMNAAGDRRASGLELFRAMPEPKQQIWVAGGHYVPPRKHSAPIVRWLHQHLD